MSKILHMSDFHFGKDLEKEKERMISLGLWLKSQNMRIDYLVFTGDVVDAVVIQQLCFKDVKNEYETLFEGIDIENTDNIDRIISEIKEHSDAVKLYDKRLKDYYDQKMPEAADILLGFMDQIGLDSERVICCCGNHDRPRFLQGLVKYKCTDNQICEATEDESFVAYDKFCEKVNKELSHYTTLYTTKDYTFIIANSNWKVPKHKESNGMCISCAVLEKKLEELKDQKIKKANAILVSHKPFDGVCENAKFLYDERKKRTTYDKIESKVNLFFYGDKHSANLKLNQDLKEFMCGMPLGHNRVRYNLVDYNPSNGECSCRSIVYMNNEWIQIPIPDCVESVYKESYDYLKDSGFKYLSGKKDKNKEWDNVIELMEKSISSHRMQTVANLFSACCTLKKDNDRIALNDEMLFEKILKLIEEGETDAPISVKGAPGMGKSTFLTIEYLYTFYRFANGTSMYIPFYFSFDKVLRESDFAKTECKQGEIIKKYINECVQEFEKTLKNWIQIGRQQSKPICLFIDGIEKQRILNYKDTLEEQVYHAIKEAYGEVYRETYWETHNKYLMCMNVHSESEFDNSFKHVNHFEYVLFLNSIRSGSYRAKEKRLDTFLQAFLDLQNRNSDKNAIEQIKKRIKQFRKMEINLFFLHHCFDLIDDADNNSSWKNMRKYAEFLSDCVEELYDTKEKQAQKLAFKVFLKGMSFQEIVEEESKNSLSIIDFINLCNNPEVTEYLLAELFVDELVEMSYTDGSVQDDSILKGFMPRNLSILVRLILDERDTHVERLLDRFIQKHIEDLKGYLFSNILYLAGHAHKGDGSRILDKAENYVHREIEGLSCFESLCCKRSHDLASIVCGVKGYSADKFIKDLMDNEVYRRFNRLYQLHYYQDIVYRRFDTWEYWAIENIDRPGFDFRNMFTALVSKLKLAKDTTQDYPMMSIDLFTLCDIIYYKLQRADEKGIFCADEYIVGDYSLAHDILTTAVDLIDYQLKQHINKKRYSRQIEAYFEEMRNAFETAQKNLITDKDDKKIYIHTLPSETFKKVLEIETLPRVGWHINKAGALSENDVTNIKQLIEKDGIKETLAEHVLESVYIAQLFLPEHIEKENYCKADVISMLLLSELGRLATQDYTPRYPNIWKLNADEKKYLQRMLLLGSKEGYGNHNKYFESFASFDRALKEHSDINMVICMEIKRIQMEYKFYTLYADIKEKFEEARIKDFKSTFQNELETNVCREIREILILKNPDFKDLINQ